MQELGAKKWSRIASALNSGRNSKQCRERWSNQINPALVRTRWTPEEDATIIRLQSELGNCWAAIAKQIPGRTDNMVKNRFNGSLKSRTGGGATPRRGRGFSNKPKSLSTGKRQRPLLATKARSTSARKRTKKSSPSKRKQVARESASINDEVAAIAALRVLSASPAKFEIGSNSSASDQRGATSARKLKYDSSVADGVKAIAGRKSAELALAIKLAGRNM